MKIAECDFDLTILYWKKMSYHKKFKNTYLVSLNLEV